MESCHKVRYTEDKKKKVCLFDLGSRKAGKFNKELNKQLYIERAGELQRNRKETQCQKKKNILKPLVSIPKGDRKKRKVKLGL